MKRIAVLMVALLVVCAAAVVAQDESSPEVTGTIYLSGGETYEGVIEVAEFGVVEGAGIGADRSPTNDYLSVQVEGEQVKVPVEDMSVVEADWQQTGPEGAKKWQVESLTITRKDGTKVSGKLHWMLHETTVRVRQADGTLARAHAFPVASADFDPAKLLIRIELGEVAATPGQPDTTPAGPDTTPAGPDTTPAGPDTTPAGPDTTPAGPDTTPAGPDTTPAGPDTTPAGPDTTPAGPDTTPAGSGAVVGAPSTITLTVVCPKCGEKITVTVAVSANSGE
jgi:hypothetical protein